MTPPTISALLAKAMHRIMPFIPAHMTAEEVTQLVYWASKKNPEILKCSGDSIIHSTIQILDWGLVINRTAFLVPYKRVCTPVAHYRGLAQLMVESRAVRHVQAHAVHKNDTFAYRYGLEAKLDHLPDPDPQTRGPLTFAYVILTLPNGDQPFEVMSIQDIEAIRAAHSKTWSPEKYPVCPDWYAIKTVVRASSKLVPTNPKFAKAVRVIERDEAEEMAAEVVDADGVVVEPPQKALPLQRPESPAVPVDEPQPVAVGGDSPFPDFPVHLRDEMYG